MRFVLNRLLFCSAGSTLLPFAPAGLPDTPEELETALQFPPPPLKAYKCLAGAGPVTAPCVPAAMSIKTRREMKIIGSETVGEQQATEQQNTNAVVLGAAGAAAQLTQAARAALRGALRG